MSTNKKTDILDLTRRDFLIVGGSGLAGAVAAQTLPDRAAAAPQVAAAQTSDGYPVVDVAPLSGIRPGTTIDFTYPDEDSPAVLIRLAEPATNGIGPNGEVVAYSILCTHKGCPVGYRPNRKLLICPCHWSTFDPAKAGTVVIGQASEPLPQIDLRVEGGMVQAIGVSGLIYGRHTNIS